MVLIFVFLAFIRERHAEYIKLSMDKILATDLELEKSLRILSGDNQPNPTIVMSSPEFGKLQRVINYYGEVGRLFRACVLTASARRQPRRSRAARPRVHRLGRPRTPARLLGQLVASNWNGTFASLWTLLTR